MKFRNNSMSVYLESRTHIYFYLFILCQKICEDRSPPCVCQPDKIAAAVNLTKKNVLGGGGKLRWCKPCEMAETKPKVKVAFKGLRFFFPYSANKRVNLLMKFSL